MFYIPTFIILLNYLQSIFDKKKKKKQEKIYEPYKLGSLIIGH